METSHRGCPCPPPPEQLDATYQVPCAGWTLRQGGFQGIRSAAAARTVRKVLTHSRWWASGANRPGAGGRRVPVRFLSRGEKRRSPCGLGPPSQWALPFLPATSVLRTLCASDVTLGPVGRHLLHCPRGDADQAWCGDLRAGMPKPQRLRLGHVLGLHWGASPGHPE